MTQTIQPRSLPMLGESNKSLTEDDINRLHSVYNKLNNLSEGLTRISYAKNNFYNALSILINVLENKLP